MLKNEINSLLPEKLLHGVTRCQGKLYSFPYFVQKYEEDKMNLNLSQVDGSILSISQFTLYADCHKGNRPSFSYAGKPAIAEPLYIYFNEYLRKIGIHVEEGIFGADMKVDLLNDGPVTIILDSDIDIRK